MPHYTKAAEANWEIRRNAKLILPGAGDEATAWDFFDAPACRDIRGSIEIEFESYGVRAMRLMLT